MDLDARIDNAHIHNGTWLAELTQSGRDRPALVVTLAGKVIGNLDLREDTAADRWLLSFTIPSEVINEGLQTFLVGPKDGPALASFTLFAGEPDTQDAMNELRLLRAEVDLIKKILRHRAT